MRNPGGIAWSPECGTRHRDRGYTAGGAASGPRGRPRWSLAGCKSFARPDAPPDVGTRDSVCYTRADGSTTPESFTAPGAHLLVLSDRRREGASAPGPTLDR